VDDGVVVQKPDGVAELVDDAGDVVAEEPLGQFESGFVDEFVDVAVGGVLADEVDVVAVVEEAVDPGHVRVVQEVVDLDLPKHVFNNVQFHHLPFLEYLHRAQETRQTVHSPVDLAVGALAQLADDPEVADAHAVGLHRLRGGMGFLGTGADLDLAMVEF
jgi:hypothetical protein